MIGNHWRMFYPICIKEELTMENKLESEDSGGKGTTEIIAT